MMLSLRELQELFAAALDAPQDAALLPLLVADRIAPRERLAVYRNNARHNGREALRAVYPVLEQLVGAEFFAAAAERYRRAHPSTSGDIHDFGRHFADFLAGLAPAAGLPYLPDMARLEWAIHEVFHAAAPPAFPLEERLAAVEAAAQARLRFRLSPACRLLASPWPLRRLWQLHQPGVAWDEGFDLASGGVELLVRRSGFEVLLDALEPGEYALLRRLANGQPLGAAFAALQRTAPAFDLAAFLQRHLLASTLADFSLR